LRRSVVPSLTVRSKARQLAPEPKRHAPLEIVVQLLLEAA